MRIALVAILAALCWAASADAGSPAAGMLELTLRGQKIEGMPLLWDAGQVHLLGRDGRLWQFAPAEAAEYHKTSDRFRSLSISELRAGLLRELGKSFEVSGTGHYLIAHPQGDRDLWTQRFEDLYRSFVHYFSVRGFQPAEPEFPLIGIVCKSREDFLRHSAQQGVSAGGGVLGYYALKSNRILLYDVGAAKGKSKDWHRNAATAIHEAAHQTAFNTGIHSRYAPPPLWVAEGLATMFEAPGVYDSYAHTRLIDRINRGQFAQFQRLVAAVHRPELLTDLIASDRLFQTSPAAAYAEAWALTFYLVESRPRDYAEYLARSARRPPFSDYAPIQRTADFTAVFGEDYRMLDAQFLRFMKSSSLSAP